MVSLRRCMAGAWLRLEIVSFVLLIRISAYCQKCVCVWLEVGYPILRRVELCMEVGDCGEMMVWTHSHGLAEQPVPVSNILMTIILVCN
jgi:hypothetical protein